jgi:hypothetical protein
MQRIAKRFMLGIRRSIQEDACYYERQMAMNSAPKRRHAAILRAVLEVAFIIFLFYSNLLMGEFTARSRHGKTLLVALNNIFTIENFLIAIICALIGYVFFEYFRKRL